MVGWMYAARSYLTITHTVMIEETTPTIMLTRIPIMIWIASLFPSEKKSSSVIGSECRSAGETKKCQKS